MQINYQFAILGFFGLIIAFLAIGYFRLASAIAKTNQALMVWEYISETPIICNFVGRIFTWLIKIRIPYSRSIGSRFIWLMTYPDFRITSLEVGRCCAQLYRRRASDGPFRCTHGVALALFAEIIAGLAVFSRLGSKGRGILLKIETEYIKKAKGMCKLYWRLRIMLGSVNGFAAFDPDEKDHTLGPVKCDVILKDSMGAVIAKVLSLDIAFGAAHQ